MSTTEFRDRVRITVTDGIADVRMTRADKRNALDMAMFGALADAGEHLKTAPGVRVAVLAGEGKSFCAGADIAEMRASGAATFEQNRADAEVLAELFRTLDAWRIFDNPFIMTQGANDTETLSFLAYRQNVTLVNLGAGSAVSVLLFFTVVLIAFVFIKGFKTDLSQVRGD